MSRRDPLQVPDVVSVEHVCRPPRWMVRAMLGMAAALAASFVVLAFVGVYVYQANEYVQGRGEMRDREAVRTEQETRELIRQAQCDLLDQFPEGGWLDGPRQKYGCGPGIPLDQLPPAVRQQLRRPPAEPAAEITPRVPSPPLGSAASPDAVPPVANTPTGPRELTPAAPPSPDPLVDLGPITEPLCDALGVCV